MKTEIFSPRGLAPSGNSVISDFRTVAAVAIFASVAALFALGEKAFVVAATPGVGTLWFVVARVARAVARMVDWPDWLLAILASRDATILCTLQGLEVHLKMHFEMRLAVRLHNPAVDYTVCRGR